MANITRGAAFVLVVVAFLSFVILKILKINGLVSLQNHNGLLRAAAAKTHKPRPNHTIQKFLKPPNPYQVFKNADKKYSQVQQDIIVYDILPIKEGFFIEMGAFDGQELSNTLWLERKHNWTGLLIEADPDSCRELEKKKRMAWRLCACISNDMDAMFLKGGVLGGVIDTLNDRIGRMLQKNEKVKIPCFRLSKVLDAIGIHQIDYFSLDVEGAELMILESMMEDLISQHLKVKIWTIEYGIFDGSKKLIPQSAIKLNLIRSFFKKIGGYSEFLHLGHKTDGIALDVLFMKTDLHNEYCKRNQTHSSATANVCHKQRRK